MQTGLDHLVATPGGPPGVIALVETPTASHTETAGSGDLATHRVIAPGDTFRLASVTKAYSGAIALSLVSRHALALSDTIGSLLPQLPHAWAAVTLAEALQHTSGLPDYIRNQAFLSALQADPHMELTPEQLLGYVASEPLAFPPGSRYEYSDTDNIVVGLMVQAATGTSFVAQLAQQVTVPLQLTQTSLPSNADLPEPYVRGYEVTAGKAPEDVSMVINPGLAWASGGMITTPTELAQFIRAYVGGRLFDQATQAEQLHFVAGSSGPPGPGTNAAGLGIFRYETACGTVYGHTGNIPGYTVFAAANAGASRSVVVVVNTQLNSTPATPAYNALRHTWELAVCAALS